MGKKRKTAEQGTGGQGPTRRQVMAWGLWAVLGIMAASAAVPIVELAARKAGGKKKLVFFPALNLDLMPEVGVMKAELNVRGGERADTRVFIKRDASGRLTVYSGICTHLGCLVSYNRLQSEFICPCHGGKYDINGVPIAGPPPRPLETLPVRIEDDEIQVGFYV